MSDKPSTSTPKSYLDSAIGAGQSVLGSLTGNQADKTTGEAKQNKAEAEHAAGHSAAKVGPATVSGGGGLAVDDPARSQGQWNQTVGSAKSAVGGLVGSEDLKAQGERQNAEGKGLEAQGQLNDLGKGVKDRVGGTLGGVGASLTGDRTKQEEYDQQRRDGKAQQLGVEKDLTKQGDARS
ncbi:MAG: hypothetical protein M1814_002228 [Vezdaea aestivalis]|nr:MAG: hypothetical protein M1814_002228 [Vezdaea aestivalis]